MGRNWAIAIGINQYRYLQPLYYAVQDAVAMCDYFSNEVRFEQVYYFSDISPPIQEVDGAAIPISYITDRPATSQLNLRGFGQPCLHQSPSVFERSRFHIA